jgi:hypothetical protein
MAGMSLQGFLFTWLLVGVLDEPADRAGFARSSAEAPPLLMLLLGGWLGDRFTARGYLMTMHALMCLPPLGVAAIYDAGALTYAWVVLSGVAMSAIQALSDPARQAVLSQVSRIDVQRSVTLMTVATSLVGIAGLYLGGQLESIGLTNVLFAQAATFLLGIVAVRGLPAIAATGQQGGDPFVGLRAAWSIALVRNAIGLNLLSSLFNAGAYVIAIPYIVTQVYGGDAAMFATVMIVFTIGGVGSNVVLLAFMPLVRAGRLFVVLQLTRVVILAVLWSEPPLWLFQTMILVWGLNMGVTSTLVRTTVQELAPAAQRAGILAVLLLSFVVASPVSAALLGMVIEAFDPLAALVPGMFVSVAVFALGRFGSGLWHYHSPTAAPVRLEASAAANRSVGD